MLQQITLSASLYDTVLSLLKLPVPLAEDHRREQEYERRSAAQQAKSIKMRGGGRRDCVIYVGDLPSDVRTREIDDVFHEVCVPGSGAVHV